jgi:hypothetical protein
MLYRTSIRSDRRPVPAEHTARRIWTGDGATGSGDDRMRDRIMAVCVVSVSCTILNILAWIRWI